MLILMVNANHIPFYDYALYQDYITVSNEITKPLEQKKKELEKQLRKTR